MDSNKKKIVLKLSGTILVDKQSGEPCTTLLHHILDQIITLQTSHQFSLVIGGGNIFRGKQHGKRLALSDNTAHQIGMLATITNGLIIREICVQKQINALLFSAIDIPSIAHNVDSQALRQAFNENQLIIFSGGTGSPFFTTDTTAIVRALQIGAIEVWKGTNVDGVYTHDPACNTNAQMIKKISYANALWQELGIMDNTAYALAQSHLLPTRIFNIFTPNALVRAALEENFGSILLSKDTIQ